MLEALQPIMVWVAALLNAVIAVAMFLNLKEIRKDRKRNFLEKRIEEFYLPLIELFKHREFEDQNVPKRANEIVFLKRYLAGKRAASSLPTTLPLVGTSLLRTDRCAWRFENEEEERKWREIANTVWDEYVEALREYYKTIGIKQYELPERPEWFAWKS